MLGLSAVPSDHRLNMGMLGMHGQYALSKLTQQCDVLIAIGMRFSARVTGLTSTYASQAKIIHLDIDKSEIDKCIKTDVAVVADCKESLPAITRLLHKAQHTEWINAFKPYQDMEEAKVIRPATRPADGPLLMGEVVRTVAEATNGEAVLVTDVGQNQLVACRYFSFRHQRSIVTSGGLGTMGFGLPAAIGATLGAPGRCVCLVTGDGGFQMSIQELGTIMEQHAPVKIILLNNNYLGNVRQWQDMFWQRRRAFTHMLNPDYATVASAYNIPYERVSDRDVLAAAVHRMLTTDGPFLLECCVKEDDNVLPMTTPYKNVDEMALTLDS